MARTMTATQESPFESLPDYVHRMEMKLKSNGTTLIVKSGKKLYKPQTRPRSRGQKGVFPMAAYYENEAAVIAALKQAKTPVEVMKIVQDLEQRMAPSHWIQRAVQALYSIT